MSSGFSYPNPIFSSPIYNPAFYLSLDASGYLTYDYAQTLYLDKNDYRLTYITGITPGTATQGVALVPDATKGISGLGAISCSSLTVAGSVVVPPPDYVLSITAGTAAPSKALVLDSSGSIVNINSLTATTLTGTLSTAAQTNITSLGTLSSLTIGGNLVFTGASRSLTGLSSLSATTLTGTLSTAAQPNITSLGSLSSLTIAGDLTMSGISPNITGATSISSVFYKQNSVIYDLSLLGATAGVATVSKALILDSSGNIYGINSIGTNQINILANGSQFNSSPSLYSFSTASTAASGLFIRSADNSAGTYSGINFLLDTDTNYLTTTPSASIACYRRTSTGYDGSDIHFWSKVNTVQTGALTRLGAFHAGGIATGQLSIGATDGSCDLNLLKGGSCSFRIGSAQSAKNCYTMTYSYSSSGSDSNHLEFNTYGTSGTLSLFSNDTVVIGSTSLNSSRFTVVGSTSNLYGSWRRTLRLQNDFSTPMVYEVILYGEAGGSNLNGVAIGTMTNDPINWMINGQTCMTLNTSKRLSVDRSSGPEATIHAGGMIWADQYFHSKSNVDGKPIYRTNWSQSNFLAWGTDATVGAMRLGICDAAFSWVSYVPVRGGAYTNASDRRLKKDIIDIPYGLAEIIALQPRRYAMKNDSSVHIGFIAQELVDIIPECVSGVESPDDELNDAGEPINPMGIDLASLTAVLCKAIQELKAELDELKAIISE